VDLTGREILYFDRTPTAPVARMRPTSGRVAQWRLSEPGGRPGPVWWVSVQRLETRSLRDRRC